MVTLSTTQQLAARSSLRMTCWQAWTVLKTCRTSQVRRKLLKVCRGKVPLGQQGNHPCHGSTLALPTVSLAPVDAQSQFLSTDVCKPVAVTMSMCQVASRGSLMLRRLLLCCHCQLGTVKELEWQLEVPWCLANMSVW